MTVQDVLTAITTVGFPIVMCLACAWYIKYTTDKQREEISKLNEAHAKEVAELNKTHAEEMEKVTQAINNNTIALTKLSERLDNIK